MINVINSSRVVYYLKVTKSFTKILFTHTPDTIIMVSYLTLDRSIGQVGSLKLILTVKESFTF